MMRIPPLIAICAACMAAICASLAWLALAERRISVATRTGISYSEGYSAEILGWFFVACFLAIIGILASFSRFKRLIWLALATLWVASLTGYVAWR